MRRELPWTDIDAAEGLGLVTEATSLRQHRAVATNHDLLGPRSCYRGNFVEATLWVGHNTCDEKRLGLVTEATSLRLAQLCRAYDLVVEDASVLLPRQLR